MNRSHKLLWVFFGITFFFISSVFLYSLYSKPFEDLESKINLNRDLKKIYNISTPEISLTELVSDTTNEGDFLVAGYIVGKNTCPPCPNDLKGMPGTCAPCPADSIRISDAIDGTGKSLIVSLPDRYSKYYKGYTVDFFDTNEKYSFVIHKSFITSSISGATKEKTPQYGLIDFAVFTPNAEPSQGTFDIDTSTWKTYRNEKYGFEFRYDQSVYFLREKGDQIILDDKNVVSSIIVRIIQLDSDQSCRPKEYVDSEIVAGSSSAEKEFKLYNGNAFQWHWIFNGKFTQTFISREACEMSDDRIIVIITEENDTEIPTNNYSKILSNFKFTK